MGCDIHELIEVLAPYDRSRHDSGAVWRCAGEAGLRRDYEMFEVLAGVRAHLGIKPIQEGRGLPSPCDMSEAATAMLWSNDGDLHSRGYVTLAELKAFDTEQEVDDPALVLSGDDAGKITGTCRGTTGAHLGPIGRRVVFGVWGRESWDRLIAEMERAKAHWGGRTDDDCRLVFAFDN